jgi:hypothetical protein
MTERPILFSAEMVRAILDGRKTQTRRMMKPQPSTVDDAGRWYRMQSGGESLMNSAYPCPYGDTGDTLWVRETCAIVGSVDPGWVLYRASGYEAECARHGFDRPYPDEKLVRWRPSIHMPRWASRITLRITDIRVERLQDITEDDARAEGCDPARWIDETDVGMEGYREGFARLWNKINGPGAWGANPWVWVVSFEKVKP